MEISGVGPAVNVLRTLELVQTHPGITATDLAIRLEVSDRAVRRYVTVLRDAGVAVDASRGRHGGYRLGGSLKPPPLVFTASEALGLVMAVLDGHHAAADPGDPVGSALGKLIASLPHRTGRQAAMVRELARAAPDRTAARPDAEVTATLVEAVATRRRVRIGYTSGAGASSELRVDPWAIVVRHGRWYLLCLAHEAGDARAYRVDRIATVTVLNAEFEPPADLNPVVWLETHLGSGWPFETHVAFDAPADVVGPWISRPMGRLEPLGDDRCVLRGTTGNPSMYAGEWLAAIPHPFRVLGGPELRAAVADVGRRLLDAVAAPDDGPDLRPTPSGGRG